MMNDNIAAWIRPEIQQLSSYYVVDANGLIKLDAMENPYDWDAHFTQTWLESLKNAHLNRYPDPTGQELKQQLCNTMQISDDLGVILGNGSDELIQMLAMAVNKPDAVILAPEPGFVMYKHIAQMLGMRYIGVPLVEGQFNLDIFAMLEAIDTYQPALTFIAYPNNPTGNIFARADIEDIIDCSPGLVVVDEAYSPFTDHSFLPCIHDHANLLVMRTVSKLGLAGLRLGYLVGSKSWLEQIDKIRLPYNINTLSQLSASFALEHYEIFQQQTQKIRQDRVDLLQKLSAMPQVETWETEANFILMRVKNAVEVHNSLKQLGVLIKCLHGSHPLLDQCLRVTVGTESENQAFLDALQQSV
ncbi:histidinol-phosphate transaminase [Candidatus Albibeggiatoa sp. nov. BB20]|uniref:histidinol-phosphate transaminase n=1 Tax=Candidatus Albibeggiatoa sp. nov. BB20 TaxID=3162723 RepID=UPI0033659A80